MDKNQANSLLNEIRNNVLKLRENLVKFIEARAWEPLGYETLADCWSVEFRDLPRDVTQSLAGLAAGAMFQQGAQPLDVALALNGVGMSTAQSMKEQYDKGVPPMAISTRVKAKPDETVVREHVRRKDSKPDHIVHVKVGAATLERYRKISKDLGSNVEREAEVALRLHFAELAVRLRSVS